MPSGSARLPQPGDVVDRFVILAEIAQGGMAAVFAVRRQGSPVDKVLALKMMLPNLAQDRRFAEMFLDEARIASRVQHPNLVQCFEVGSAGELPFLVMEHLHGRSFARCLSRAHEGGEGDEQAFVLGVLSQAARGLAAAHETKGSDGLPLGLVHRDVTPTNVHVGYDGHVKVVDFGIAAARGRIATTRTGEVKGKTAYLAPEMIDRSQPVDRRADMWSFGVMAYESLSRTKLFAGDDEARTMFRILHDPIRDLDEIAPRLPPSVVEIVTRCLQRRIRDRPEHMDEVAAALEGAGAMSARDIARWMQARFAEERARDEAHLAAATRADGERGHGETGRRASAREAAAIEAPPRRRWWVAVAAGALVLAAAGAAASMYDASAAPSTSAAPPRMSPPTAAPVPEEPAAAPGAAVTDPAPVEPAPRTRVRRPRRRAAGEGDGLLDNPY